MPDLSLLGPFPPPYGGVALHLIRLMESLRARGIPTVGASTGGVPPSLNDVRRVGWRDAVSSTPVHLHTDEGNARLTVLMGKAWAMRGRRYGLTVHSFRERPDLQHLDAQLMRVYQRARLIVAISEDVRNEVCQRLHVLHERVHVITSALPVSTWELQQPPPSMLPQAWLQAPARVLANAGRVVRYKGSDLYGIDTLITAFRLLDAPQASLLIVVGEVVDVSLHQELLALAAADPRIHVVSRLDSPLSTITHLAHVVVRPTRTEGGESLTLAEALELGAWAVGSDAVQRPANTVLFETGNAESLHKALREVLSREQQPTRHAPSYDAVDALVNAYRETGLLPTLASP